MKIGVFSALLSDRTLEEALDLFVALGVDAVELGTGGYSGNAHCNPGELLKAESKLQAFRDTIEKHDLPISALSCHGNPLHPQISVARTHHLIFDQTVKLASKLGVGTVINFSGCPGASAEETKPSWIVSAWPAEFAAMLEWQWSERVIPYWREVARTCRAAGVKVAVEMHPNFNVYNPETMLRLRDVAPDVIRCNFDPSHLFWQGIDPVAAIRALGDCIGHVHVKDCRLEARNVAVNGVLDTKPFAREADRSWLFRTIGDGHDVAVWKDIMNALRDVGYDGVLSIEQEDSALAPEEGLRKAIGVLEEVLAPEPVHE
jgi:sugar phosphate isomerase/epimerase